MIYELFHNVDIQEATIYAWLKDLSPEFIKGRLTQNSNDLPVTVKVISVDGSYVNLSSDIIGKKRL